MEAEGGEFQDWEVLHHNFDAEALPFIGEVAEAEESCDLVGDSEGMVQNNYFSLESKKKFVVSDDRVDSEVSSKSSDNPSWIDPAFDTQYQRKHSAESWSDSSSDRSDGKKYEFEGKFDVGFVQSDQDRIFEGGFDGVEHMIAESGENLEVLLSDSGGVSSGEMIVEGVQGSGELGMKKDAILGEEDGGREGTDAKGETEVNRVEEKKGKRGMVWWRLPIEFLRYCVFKGPVWTVSVAAAFMGFVILGRRLYKMKKKSKALGPRVIMDDKKISQFMSRAARLNEAFSVVKRVPVIRPSLPAVGVTPWPVVSLR
ncbi:hypothetical protein Leryth_016865 [Lithospermum erythrorhizon]|nr:hypothetical protein Leryth_016865 [Lithospermum erythrorhizon]